MLRFGLPGVISPACALQTTSLPHFYWPILAPHWNKTSSRRGSRFHSLLRRHPGGKGNGVLFKRSASCLMNAADEVMGSGLGLHINPPDVFTQHTDPDQLNATKERHGHHQGGVPGHISTHTDRTQRNHRGLEETETRHEDTKACPHLQGKNRGREFPVEGVT